MATYYWGSATAAWTSASWSTTSNAGPYTAGPPTASDDAIFNATSTGTATVAIGGGTCNSLVMTAGTVTGSGHNITIAGKNGSGISAQLTSGFGPNLVFTDTSGTVNKVTFGGASLLTCNFNGIGGSWQIQDTINFNTFTSSSVIVSAGTVDFNGQNVTTPIITVLSSANANVLLGSGTFTIGVPSISATPSWSFGAAASLNAGTSTIKFTGVGSSTPTFAGGGKAYNTVLFTGSGTGAFNVSGSNTFGVLSADTPPHTITFANGSTQTITSLSINGSAGNLMTLNTDSAGNAVNFVGAGSAFSCDYISLQDNHLTGAQGLAGTHSTLVSGNSGWSLYVASLGAATTIKLMGVASPIARAVLAASTGIVLQARGAARGFTSITAATAVKIRGAIAATCTFPAAARTSAVLRSTATLTASARLATSAKISLQAIAALSGSASITAAAAIKVRSIAAATYTTALAARTAGAMMAGAGAARTASMAAVGKIAMRAGGSIVGSTFLAAAAHIQARGTAAVGGATSLAARTAAALSARVARLGVLLSGRTSISVTARAVMKLFRLSPRVAVTTFESRSASAAFQSRTAATSPANETSTT